MAKKTAAKKTASKKKRTAAQKRATEKLVAANRKKRASKKKASARRTSSVSTGRRSTKKVRGYPGGARRTNPATPKYFIYTLVSSDDGPMYIYLFSFKPGSGGKLVANWTRGKQYALRGDELAMQDLGTLLKYAIGTPEDAKAIWVGK